MIDVDALPNTWIKVNLGDIADIVMGQSPPGSTYNNDENGLPLVAGASDLGEIFPRPSKWTTAPTKMSEAGDLIYCIRATIGEMNWADRQYCLGRGVAAIRIDKTLADPEFIYFWLYSLKDYIISQATGSTFLQIRKRDIEAISVSLPTLLEQSRIIDILRQADEKKKARDRATELIQHLGQSLFVEMFGYPIKNERKWATSRLSDLCEVTTGNTPPRNNPNNYGDFIEWIKSDNLGNNLRYIDPSSEYLSEEGAKIGRIVPAGSTLITCIAGSPDSIGKAGLSDRDVAFNQQINALTPFDDVNPLFLYGAILLYKRAIQALSSGGMKGIVNKTRLSNLEIIKPPKELQDQFAARLLQAFSLRESLYKSEAAMSMLFKSLISSAFSGRLTTDWRANRINELQEQAVQRDIILGIRGEKPTIGDYESGRVTESEREEIERLLAESIKPLLENMARTSSILGENIQAMQRRHAEQMAQIVQSIKIPQIYVQPIYTTAITNSLARFQQQMTSIAETNRKMIQNMAASMQPMVKQFNLLLERIATEIDEYPPSDHPRYDIASKLSRQQKFLFWICDHQETHFTVESIQEKTGLSTDIVRRALDLFASLGLILPVSIQAQSSTGDVFTPAFRRIKDDDGVRLIDLELLEEGQL